MSLLVAADPGGVTPMRRVAGPRQAALAEWRAAEEEPFRAALQGLDIIPDRTRGKRAVVYSEAVR